MEGVDMSLSGIRKDNKAERYAWAKKYRNYTLIDWRQWVISDETRSDGDNTLLPHQMEPHVHGYSGGVMLWSGITATGPGYGTTIIDGSIDSSVYVDILETSLLDTLCNRAPSHTSVITNKRWFNEHGFSVDTIMNWPARSPGLNPIEHVWYPLKRRPNAYPTRPTTKEELEQRIIVTEWYKFTEKGCLKYIDSMPARIKAIIKSKGGPTKY
ncbi:hypothetical protein INT46_004527 [Mucor plumbeus]|uniref:Tc1-like transposase DDE domain-containing protein n=1 Tax=Mucor plumbeus TaxID=97098 RepID=A0A8H7QWV4_9FUNG|nr:hypothetical protein INT46_004527 [Mucor plumbeus]